jgi:flagellar export protein FliJ
VHTRHSGTAAIDVRWLLATDRYGAALREDRDVCELKRSRLAEEFARIQEALVSADRDVRTLEKLRERKLVSHRAALQRREQQELDEIAARVRAPAVDESPANWL